MITVIRGGIENSIYNWVYNKWKMYLNIYKNSVGCGKKGKLIKGIMEEVMEEEVLEDSERESIWCEMKKWSKEERKGWKKYIWE